LNSFPNIHPHQLAISDLDAQLSFDIPPDSNGGVGRLSSPGGNAGAQTVTSVTLDRFVEEHGITRLDAMKIDVEGSEMRVLAGARETIARFKPAMVIEFNPPCLKNFATDGGQLLREISALGYDIFRAKPSGLKKFDGLHPGETYTNIFCLPRKSA